MAAMKRREFIKTGVKAGLAVGLMGSLPVLPSLARNSLLSDKPTAYDLVAIKGGEPHLMFDKAIRVLGGMKKFVSPGDKVVVKPNIGWDVPPERAGNTNPVLVKRIIEHCFEAGAREVYVFDNTCNNWIKCYKNSGIQYAVKEAGGKMVPANTENYYQKVELKNARKLKTTQVHELILSADVFINVPILKHHGSADLTISMKNLMGVVWDRRWWHKNDLHQCIADFAGFYRKPDLNVVDAYRIMYRNGPRGISTSDVKILKTQLISTDMVTVDAAAAKLLGKNPMDIRYIKLAHEQGYGNANLSQLKIARLSI